eukprot:gene6093-biopygen3901
MGKVSLIDATNFPVIFTVVELIAMALTVMGTPIQQYNLRGNWRGKKPCYTLWGYKSDCGSIAYDAQGVAAWECAKRTHYMNAAAAFAVISIVTAVATVVLGLLMVCNRFRYIKVLALCCITVSVALLICWACLATVYNSKMCAGATFSGTSFSESTKYAAGFAVLVAAWCVQILNGIFTALMLFVWSP